MFIQLLTSILFLLTLPFFFLIITKTFKSKKSTTAPSPSIIFPKSYPIIGSYFAVKSNRSNRLQWTTQIL
ncbi:hypothetical protein CRYUN_Cryun01aG0163500 [Craigia yunnanensis]